MKKLIPLIFVLAACSKKDVIIPIKDYSFSIDSVLNQTGTKSLAIDNNGLYHLKLQPNQNQQPYRITGHILVNGKEPYPNESISFESNLYWWINKGDTVAYITKSYINYFTGQYTIVKLPPLVSNKDELVPTINSSCYSGKGGQINVMIAPIGDMKGDTMIVKAMHTPSKKTIYTKIVLE